MAELKLDLAVDSSKAVRGVKDFGEALEDVVDDLESVSKEGKDTGSDLEKVFRDVARDAKKHGDDAGDNLKKGLKSGTDDFKDEAASSGKEAAASFSGEFSDVTGAIQEIAANAFEGFGPAGAIAGGAAAVGIGLLTAAFEQAEEKRLALEEAAMDLAQAYIDAGSTVLNEMEVASRSAEVLTSTDPKVKTDLKDLTDLLKDRALAARVLAGDTEALSAANEILIDREEKLSEYSTQARENTGKRKTAIGEEAEAVERLSELLGEQAGIQQSAVDVAQAHTDILIDLAREAGTATEEVDEFGNRLLTLPSGVQILIDAETGQATTDVSNFKGDVDGIPEEVSTKAKFSVDDWEVRNYQPPNKTAYVTYRGVQPV